MKNVFIFIHLCLLLSWRPPHRPSTVFSCDALGVVISCLECSTLAAPFSRLFVLLTLWKRNLLLLPLLLLLLLPNFVLSAPPLPLPVIYEACAGLPDLAQSGSFDSCCCLSSPLNSDKMFNCFKASFYIKHNGRFCLGTYGDGDVRRHLQPLWAVFRCANLPHLLLASMCFALFGLGNFTYRKFNGSTCRLFFVLVKFSALPLILPNQLLVDKYSQEKTCGAFVPWMHAIAEHDPNMVSSLKVDMR